MTKDTVQDENWAQILNNKRKDSFGSKNKSSIASEKNTENICG